MPLIKGAKPGTKSFGKNIASEIEAGKPPKQAQAIAYSESGEHKRTRSVPMKSEHHKKAAHHMKEAAKHHEKTQHHMEKVKHHNDVKEDKALIKKEVKKTSLKKEKY